MIRFDRRFSANEIKLLIFDLDGTLIDSRLDLVHSVNAMLRHFKRPELPDKVIGSYVGDGAPVLVRRALGDPADQSKMKEALEFFLAYYRVHKLDHTHLYPGVKEMLAAVRSSDEMRREMAILSNKPVVPSRAIVEALGLAEFFSHVYGGNSFPTKKPDPEGVRKILADTHATSKQTVMIGDSSVDVITGRNAGLWTCGVTYGFAPHTFRDAPPDVSVDSVEELMRLFA
ncbi:MAG: HAD-IA family hydrolase [Acidobacteriaceae bacterium]|nr:HAD-IA family hydrolase [Acidobacteriaceae bacterium]